MTQSDEKKRDEMAEESFKIEYAKFKKDERRPFSYNESFRHGWDDCKLHSPDVQALVEALEFECGNRCHPEHNPCNARQALSKWRKGDS